MVILEACWVMLVGAVVFFGPVVGRGVTRSAVS